jgi:hypothetical protein
VVRSRDRGEHGRPHGRRGGRSTPLRYGRLHAGSAGPPGPAGSSRGQCAGASLGSADRRRGLPVRRD